MPMTLVQTVDVFSSDVSITSIPQTGKDLLVLADLRASANTTNATVTFRVNADTGANYSTRRLRGQPASGATSDFQSGNSLPWSGEIPGDTSGTTTYGSIALYIPDYANSSSTKRFGLESVSPANSNNAPMNLVSQGWSTNSAITSIQVRDQGPNTMQGSISIYIIS